MDQDIWQNILNKLESHIDEKSFNTFFIDTSLIKINKNELHIKVSTKFASNYLNQNYVLILSEIAKSLYHKKYDFIFISDEKTFNQKPYNYNEYQPKNFQYRTKLNPNYNFDQFVVGKSNNFAYSSSLAVAENLGVAYNPLFIYGDSGMGKTHLMQSIGNYVVNENEVHKVFYITAEEFTNNMIESLKKNKMEEFRGEFRNIDVLLIDDIHFFTKKEAVQEEFFHTFNSLNEKKKQIVLTSDKPPKDIQDLEKRLVTRFEGGLLADLSTPDFETRVAILRKKSESDKIVLSEEIINFIAENIIDNIRTLEGALIRILAYSSFNNIPIEKINRGLASKILVDLISDKIKNINLDSILEKVCFIYDLTKDQILSKSRKKNIVFPRQIAMYISNLMIPQISLKEIAVYYKRKDHTTVIHARKLIENQLKKDNLLRVNIKEIMDSLK